MLWHNYCGSMVVLSAPKCIAPSTLYMQQPLQVHPSPPGTCPYINIYAGTAPAVHVQLYSVVHSSFSGTCSCTFFCHVLVISFQPVRSLQPYSAAAVHELKHHSLRPECKSQWQILLPCMWCFCSFLVKCQQEGCLSDVRTASHALSLMLHMLAWPRAVRH